MLPRSSMLNRHQALAKAYFKRLGRRQDRHAANLDLAMLVRYPANLANPRGVLRSAPIGVPAERYDPAPQFEGATAFCAGRVIYQNMPVVKIRRHRHVDLAQGEF